MFQKIPSNFPPPNKSYIFLADSFASPQPLNGHVLEKGSDQLFAYRGIDSVYKVSQSADPNHVRGTTGIWNQSDDSP